MKRNNLRNLFCLLLVVLSLYLLDNTRLTKYIGYQKVKELIKEDINVFGVSKGFFGDKLFSLYNLTSTVSSSVIRTEEYGDGYLVYQSDNRLYSTMVGSVINITKDSVTIGKVNGSVVIKNLIEINVSLYQKIEADTLIGYIDEYYYYEEN